MSEPRAYFKGLRLGDFQEVAERLSFQHSGPNYQNAVGAEAAHAWFSGPNAYFEIAFEIAFKRGFSGAEGTSAFYDRLRTFGTSLKRALAYGGGVPQRGPLCFVRDPDGSRFDEADSTTTTEAILGSGTESITCTSVDAAWATGQRVLVFDPANPYTTFEVVTLVDADDVSDTIEAAFTKAYPSGAEVHRLEWYLPDATLDGAPDFGGAGAAQRGFRKGIRLAFSSPSEPVNGGLTS